MPGIGGAEIHMENLIRELLKAGNRVVFLTHQDGVGALDDKIEIERIGRAKKFLPQIWRYLWRQSRDAEVLHAHYCHRLGFLMSLIGRLRHKPVIITLHGYGILDHPGHNFRQKLTHSFWRFWSLKLCARIISTSQDLADRAYRYVPREKVIIIPSGYNPEIFNNEVRTSPGIEEKYRGKKVILTVRRLVPKTGIQYLVEALPQIIKEEPEAYFMAIGSGGMRPEIEKRVRELGLEKSVEFSGTVANERVPQYLAAAAVVVFPSTAESSSLACAESMAMGKKIVASRVGGLIELLGRNQERGRLVDLVSWRSSSYSAPERLPAESYRVLAAAVIESLRDDSADRQLAARKFAEENLAWPTIVKKTLDVYQGVIAP